MLRSTSSRAPRVLLVAAVALAAATALAGKEPSAELKRQLFPAREALGLDSLAAAAREAKKAMAMDPAVTEPYLILGEVGLRTGDLAAARANYKKVLELGGSDAAAHAGLALLAVDEDDLATAETEANAAVAADKGLWIANYALGRAQLAKGKTDEAFKTFEKGKSLKTRADGRDLFEIGMGLVALAEKDAQGAETNFIKARALAPNTIWSTMNLASMYEKTNQWAQAGNVLKAAESKFGTSPVLSYRLGRAFENQQQWNEALRQYQKAYNADSTYAPVLAALGHLFLLDSRKTPQAVNVLTRAVEKNPTPEARRDLGIALTRAGKPAEAVAQLEAVAQADPSIETKVALARAYIAADMLDKGLPLYQDVDVALEAPAADLLAVGNALIKVKKYEEARPWLDKALEKDPKLSDVYARRGFIEMMNKNYDAALKEFDKKIEMDPKNPTVYLNRGATLLQLGRKPEGIESYRMVTQLAPNNASAWIQLGEVLVADSPKEAQQAFDKALAIDAANVRAKRGKGLTFLQLDQYPQSISLLKEATQADPNDAEGLVWLGQAYLNSGNQTEARAAFQRALKVDPANKMAQDLLQQMSGAANSH